MAREYKTPLQWIVQGIVQWMQTEQATLEVLDYVQSFLYEHGIAPHLVEAIEYIGTATVSLGYGMTDKIYSDEVCDEILEEAFDLIKGKEKK